MRIVNADPQQVLSAVMRIPRPSKTAVAFTGLGLATLGYAVKSGTSHMRTPAQIQWFGQTQTPTFKKYVVDEVGEPPGASRGAPAAARPGRARVARVLSRTPSPFDRLGPPRRSQRSSACGASRAATTSWWLRRVRRACHESARS